MLHGALRLADHARADVLKIDTAAALAAPGVKAVFTAADVPGELRVGIIHADWPVFIPEGGRTSYLGDVLAFVVADSREAAREAAKLVEVSYRPLRPLTDAVAAIDDPEDAVWELEGNVLARRSYRRGDVDMALAASAHTVHEVFQTQRVEHAFLEPESTLAVPAARRHLEGLLGRPGRLGRPQPDRLGARDQRPSRSWSSRCPTAAPSAARRTCPTRPRRRSPPGCSRQPVKCTLSREESLLLAPQASSVPHRVLGRVRR